MNLQNNFTTPEQSKRLLMLGVPADSADCYHDLSLNRRGILSINGVYSLDVPYNHLFSDGKHQFLPCWSAGRLREIFCICSSVSGNRDYPFCNDQVAWWITEFEFKKKFIDFSKLEEQSCKIIN